MENCSSFLRVFPQHQQTGLICRTEQQEKPTTKLSSDALEFMLLTKDISKITIEDKTSSVVFSKSMVISRRIS